MDRFLTLMGSLAWPLATLVLAMVFRRDLGQALGRVGQFKYRDLEVTFREDLHRAEQLARSIPSPGARGAIVLETVVDEAVPLVGRLIVSPSSSEEPLERHVSPVDPAGLEPREAVEAAWGVVARSLARGKKLHRSPGPEAPLVGLLRKLRDRATRPDLPPPSPEDARRFVALAHRVASRLEEIG